MTIQQVKDPYMLLSLLNTKLRDEEPTLESLCKAHSIDINEIMSIMKKIGYIYNEKTNQFIAGGGDKG